MFRAIRAFFAWRKVRSTGIWDYYENDVTGQRKAFKERGGHQPLDFGFLRKGDKIVEPRGVHIVGQC